MPDFSTGTTKKARKTAVFTMDGVSLTAQQPKALAFLDLADLADLDLEDPANTPRVLRATESFLNDCLDGNSRSYIQGRLYDPDDDFDVDDLVPILQWLAEEFTGKTRPTTPSSGSQATRARTGRGSTGRARSAVSTPPTSTPPGS